ACPYLFVNTRSCLAFISAPDNTAIEASISLLKNLVFLTLDSRPTTNNAVAPGLQILASSTNTSYMSSMYCVTVKYLFDRFLRFEPISDFAASSSEYPKYSADRLYC